MQEAETFGTVDHLVTFPTAQPHGSSDGVISEGGFQFASLEWSFLAGIFQHNAARRLVNSTEWRVIWSSGTILIYCSYIRLERSKAIIRPNIDNYLAILPTTVCMIGECLMQFLRRHSK